MESLIVDLDKVLDDFEAEETQTSQSKTPTLSTDYSSFIAANEEKPWEELNKVPILSSKSENWTDHKTKLEKTNALYDVPYIPAEQFDLAEADFAPAIGSKHSSMYSEGLLSNDRKGENMYDSISKHNHQMSNNYNYDDTVNSLDSVQLVKKKLNEELNAVSSKVIDTSETIDLNHKRPEPNLDTDTGDLHVYKTVNHNEHNFFNGDLKTNNVENSLEKIENTNKGMAPCNSGEINEHLNSEYLKFPYSASSHVTPSSLYISNSLYANNSNYIHSQGTKEKFPVQVVDRFTPIDEKKPFLQQSGDNDRAECTHSRVKDTNLKQTNDRSNNHVPSFNTNKRLPSTSEETIYADHHGDINVDCDCVDQQPTIAVDHYDLLNYGKTSELAPIQPKNVSNVQYVKELSPEVGGGFVASGPAFNNVQDNISHIDNENKQDECRDLNEKAPKDFPPVSSNDMHGAIAPPVTYSSNDYAFMSNKSTINVMTTEQFNSAQTQQVESLSNIRYDDQSADPNISNWGTNQNSPATTNNDSLEYQADENKLSHKMEDGSSDSQEEQKSSLQLKKVSNSSLVTDDANDEDVDKYLNDMYNYPQAEVREALGKKEASLYDTHPVTNDISTDEDVSGDNVSFETQNLQKPSSQATSDNQSNISGDIKDSDESKTGNNSTLNGLKASGDKASMVKLGEDVRPKEMNKPLVKDEKLPSLIGMIPAQSRVSQGKDPDGIDSVPKLDDQNSVNHVDTDHATGCLADEAESGDTLIASIIDDIKAEPSNQHAQQNCGNDDVYVQHEGEPPTYDSIDGGEHGDGASTLACQQQKRPSSLNLPPRGEFNTERVQAPYRFPYSEETDSPSVSSETPENVEDNSMAGTSEERVIEGAEGGFTEQEAAMAAAETSTLGKVAPIWLPDSEAPVCMGCGSKFTFTKRRHHCRGCGKVFCSACCNLKSKLEYMENKEARVCQPCHQQITIAEITSRTGRSPNPNNPSEYCSTIPPSQQACSRSPPPSVMVPVGVLKREGSVKKSEPKQVMFSDGIRPGGDLTELDGAEAANKIPSRKGGRSLKKSDKSSPDGGRSQRRHRDPDHQRSRSLIPENGLPPVLLSGNNAIKELDEHFDQQKYIGIMRDESADPVAFLVNSNLIVFAKVLNLDCCVNRECWCFTTRGLCSVGQDEMVIVLETQPDEEIVPRDIFVHFQNIYEEAGKGNMVSDLDHSIVNQNFLGSPDHCGMLYIRPTFQCLQKLILPESPYVFGILLQKWEVPWAKVFPIRLMLRLGAEYRYYPCPLISVRNRKPVFFEIGHTIMNLLADFRNYQYMLPQINGVTVHMEDKKTIISFPRNRYNELMKVVSSSNEHVMAIGACFSCDADSHLVCIQNDEGNYQTQAINIQNKPRKVTGASFVVFNGALKQSSGLKAKSSIVEDGLMVQITPESMVALKQAMRDMKAYVIECGSISNPAPDELVTVHWGEDDRNVNIGVKSPIDNMSMDGIESIHIPNATDYVGEKHAIRWTDVFFIQNQDSGSVKWEPVDLSRLAETLANACCIALARHLDRLQESGLNKIGLRVNIQSEMVEYEIGAKGEKLAPQYMNDLDNELIPVINSAATQTHGALITLELVFHILD